MKYKQSSGIDWSRSQSLFPSSDRYVVIDVETANSYRDIIEIACVEIINNKIERTISQRIKPLTTNVNPFCMKVHGISLRDVANSPYFSDFSNKLVSFVGNSPILAHNRAAEYKSLLFEFEQINKIFPYTTDDFYCTMKMAKSLKLNGKLREMAQAIGINISHLSHHDALSDTLLAANLFIKMKTITPKI